MVQHAGFVPLDFVTVIKLLRLRERASVPSFASCSILYLFHSLPYCGWKKSCTTWDGWNPINRYASPWWYSWGCEWLFPWWVHFQHGGSWCALQDGPNNFQRALATCVYISRKHQDNIIGKALSNNLLLWVLCHALWFSVDFLRFSLVWPKFSQFPAGFTFSYAVPVAVVARWWKLLLGSWPPACQIVLGEDQWLAAMVNHGMGCEMGVTLW